MPDSTDGRRLLTNSFRCVLLGEIVSPGFARLSALVLCGNPDHPAGNAWITASGSIRLDE